MRTLGTFIEEISPKFNKQMVEGLCYHRMKTAVEYIDRFIKYGCRSKTDTHLKYLGYKEVSPKDELKYLFGAKGGKSGKSEKSGKTEYDIAENDIYLVKFFFQYAEYDVREELLYVPYMHPGNIIHLSGNRRLVMPVLADKVISVGEKIIFINILTAKYNFSRTYTGVVVNGKVNRVPVINTELYKNQSKKIEDTTKANTTVLHYLLANYGYSATMKLLLGFVPMITLNDEVAGHVVIKSTGTVPQGYIRNKQLYQGSQIKFAVPLELYNERSVYCVGNLFYIIDNFPDSIFPGDLDDVGMWRRLLGEIIHSGNHSLNYLSEKINAHFNDLNSRFDNITIDKLADVGVNATNLIELINVIFLNFNEWIMNASPRSLYNNKTYEVESFALSNITSRITRIVLDINKEELRVDGGVLESKIVDKIFQKYFKTKTIFSLKNERLFVASVDYTGDHLYPKNTSMVIQQESDFVNVNDGEANTSEKKKLVASMATVGSILGLSKTNPTPVIRMNPYVNVDPVTGTILPNPQWNHIIEETDKLLANMVLADSVELPDSTSLELGIEDDLADELLDDDFDEEQIDID